MIAKNENKPKVIEIDLNELIFRDIFRSGLTAWKQAAQEVLEKTGVEMSGDEEKIVKRAFISGYVSILVSPLKVAG